MAKGKRKEVEKFIKEWIYKITKSKSNVKLYEELFKNMKDKEFEEFIRKLGTGEMMLNIVIPHDGDHNISLRRNIETLAKELGYDFHQHLYIGPTEDAPKYKTPNKYFILTLPFRRAKQTIEKGISYSEHDRRIDALTGQPTDESRSSRISYPELQLLVGMGMKDSAIELLRDRGGDPGAYYAIKNALLKYGRVSEKLVNNYTEGVISTSTLKALFAGMHFKINL